MKEQYLSAVCCHILAVHKHQYPSDFDCIYDPLGYSNACH